MTYFNPQPKKPPIKLSELEYHQMKMDLYFDQNGRCYKCLEWFPFNEMSFHHLDTGGMGMKGSDVDENGKPLGYLCCLKCHPD